MNYLILLITILVFSQISCTAQKNSGENYAKIKTEKFVRINDINSKKFAQEIYETEGFVAKIYTCPPCPPNALCKPCMRNNIVISEENKILESYNLSDKEIIVFTENAETFELNKKYFFKIKITDRKTTSQTANDIELLAYNNL